MQISGNFTLNAELFKQVMGNSQLNSLTQEQITEANKKAELQKAVVAISQSEALEQRIIAQKRAIADAILGNAGVSGYSSYGSMRQGYLNYFASNDTFSYGELNSYGKGNVLKTPFGDMEVFLDLDGDNDKYGVGKLKSMGQLLNLDVNRDGILNREDDYFDKLKLRGYNSKGEEVVLKFTDVFKDYDLTRFVEKRKFSNQTWSDAENPLKGGSNKGTNYRAMHQIENGTAFFRPEESYKKIDGDVLKALFEAYGDEDGWITIMNEQPFDPFHPNEPYGPSMDNVNLFGVNGLFHNFAYVKKGLNGQTRLESFNISQNFYGYKDKMSKRELIERYGSTSGISNGQYSYSWEMRQRFNAMYEDYHNADATFASKLAIEREFQVVTGEKFTQNKFEDYYRGINDPVETSKYLATLKDTDSVVAMRYNENGSITLKFNSGRTLNVDELYGDMGEFNLSDRNNKEIKQIDTQLGIPTDNGVDNLASQFGVIDNGEMKSLAELGVEFIQKTIFANGQNAFILTTGDGKEMVVANLYKIRSVEDMVRFGEIDEEEKLRIKYEWDA